MTESARIASLETQVRTLKRMLFGVFGLLVAGAVLGATSLQTVPDVIQAKKFEVVNQSGLVVGTFQSWEDRGLVSLRDSMKRPTVVISSELSTGVASGFLTTMNSKGSIVASVGVNEAGNGVVATEDGRGKRLVEVGSDSHGGRLRINNAKGEDLVSLRCTGSDSGWVAVRRKSTDRIILTGGIDEEGGMLIAYDNKQNPLTVISPTSSGGTIVTFDSKGNGTSETP